MVNLVTRRRAGADEQARRHRRHAGGPGRRDRRGRRPLRAGPLLAPTRRSTSTSTCGPGRTSDNPVYYVQYVARPDRERRPQRRRRRPDPRRRRRSTPRCSTTRRRTTCSRRSASIPAVVATAAELREPHRVARYLEELAGAYHRFYDNCRVLPARRRGDHRPAPAPGCGSTTPPARCIANGLGLLGVTRPGADVTHRCGAHEAGALHGELGHAGPPGCVPPTTSTRSMPQLWPRTVRARTPTARCASAGSTSRDLAARVRHARRTCSTRTTSAPRCRDFQAALRRRATSTTPARRSCARRSCASSPRRGCSLDVCTGGELAVALRGRHAAGADRPARQQQVGAPS